MAQKLNWKLILLPLIGIFVAFVFLEIFLRTTQLLGEKKLLGLNPSRTTITWYENPVIGKVLLTPHTKGWFVTPSKEYFTWVEANSEGFYDSEHTPQKAENTFRILLLGDSFVASLQTPWPNTLSKQLEKSFNNLNPPKNIEVIAMGMGDTGTAQQYLALKNLGLKYQPDLVIHMFLTANDLKNNYPSLQKDPYRPYLALGNKGNLVELPYQKQSARPLSLPRETIKNLRLAELTLSIRQKFMEALANKKSDYPLDYHVYDTKYSSDYENAWQLTQKLILESKKISEDEKSRYLLVTLANNEQVNKDVWEKLQMTYPKMKGADLDLGKPDRMIESFCRDESIDCLFMLPAFDQYSASHSGEPTHFRYDGHWNGTGTKLAVEVISDYFKSHLSDYFSIK